MVEPCASDRFFCEDGSSTELDCRFLLEVEELLAPQSVTQLLEEVQGDLSSGLELFPPHFSSDQDSTSSSCSSSGTPVNAFESEPCIDYAAAVDAVATQAEPSAPAASTKTKKRAPRSRTYLKTELECLRSKVAELDTMLKELQLKEMKATADSLGDILVGSVMPPAVRLVLQSAAEPRAKSPLDPVYGQQVDHIRAVLENLKLRSLFMEKMAIEKDMGSVFCNRVRGFVTPGWWT